VHKETTAVINVAVLIVVYECTRKQLMQLNNECDVFVFTHLKCIRVSCSCFLPCSAF
jgi:hypothetical protein